MGLDCADPAVQGDRGAHVCRPSASRDFGGIVPPRLMRIEDATIRDVFRSTRESWERNARYHAYHVSTLLVPGKATPLQRVWHTYASNPAPSLSKRDRPIKTGDRTFAFGNLPGRLPMPGGMVTHVVIEPYFAFINLTEPAHVLFPGYIMRWLALEAFGVVGHTVGRGVGLAPRTNEDVGAELFGELDKEIRAEL